MNELTDIEICKRIGEIEKLNGDFGTHRSGVYGRRFADGSFKQYNPLTDDALNHQLMIKYKVLITWNPHINNNCTAVIDGTSEDLPFPFAISDCNDKLPSKAICLAIIEAHKDQS